MPETSFSVVRNEDYWQEGLPHPDGIRFDLLPGRRGPGRCARGRRRGRDHGYNPVILDRVRADAEAGEVISNGRARRTSSLNVERAPFDDLTARQAIAHATDAWRAEAESPADGQGPPSVPARGGAPWPPRTTATWATT